MKKFQLTNQEGRSYQRIRVLAAIASEVEGGDDVVVEGRVDPTGRVEIDIDVPAASKAGLRLIFLGPDDEVLEEHALTTEAFLNLTELEVVPPARAALNLGLNPTLDLPAALRGRVVDARDGSGAAGRGLVIRGVLAGDGGLAVLGSTRTDSHGYFSIPYPRGKFAAATGVVDGGTPAVIRLDEDAFPAQTVLVVDDLETREGTCCPEDVPRAPDSEALATSLGTFSADSDPTSCVDFRSKPDRSLQEFRYYAVVRTTQPFLHGLPNRKRMVDPIGLQFSLPLPDLTRALSNGLTASLAAMADESQEKTPRERFPAKKTAAKKIAAKKAASKIVAATRRSTPMAPGGTAPFAPVRDVPVAAGLLAHLAKPAAKIRYRFGEPERLALGPGTRADWLWEGEGGERPREFYEAATISLGHILVYKQSWHADGYSLGDLLYSLPLAPCQKKQIAVLDWDRDERGARQESLALEEELSADLIRDRDIREALASTLAESMDAGSAASTKSASASLGLFGAGGFLGISGGASSSSSSTWQDSSRDLESSFSNMLRDRTMQSQSAMRRVRSTVVRSVGQHENVAVTTEVVANHNHCHALTVQYFEVLRHFLIRQRLESVRECLFFPLPMVEITGELALRWRSLLETRLLDRGLRSHFDAMTRLRDSGYEYRVLADQVIEWIEGDLYLEFQLAQPVDDEKGEYRPDSWEFLGRSLASLLGREVHRRMKETPESREKIFQQELGPRIAENFVEKLRFRSKAGQGLDLQASLVDRYQPGGRLRLRVRSRREPGVLRRDLGGIEVFVEAPPDFESLTAEQRRSAWLPENSKVLLRTAALRYRPGGEARLLPLANVSVDGNLAETIGTTASRTTIMLESPVAGFEKRNRKAEDQRREATLVAHLDQNREHYHRIVWKHMDPDRRYLILDAYEAPLADGRSVASVVENKILGIAGNSLILPVAAGVRLDPALRTAADERKAALAPGEAPRDTVREDEVLLRHYAPTTSPEPVRFSTPTKGVFAEAVMGYCNACEKVDDSRFWRWSQEPCTDQPTAIQAPSLGSRQTEMDLTPTPAPPPIVQFQNAPPAPAPSGMNAALATLASAGAFRDLTGLAGTQGAAAAALAQSMSTADASAARAASVAANLAMARQTTDNLDKILGSVDKLETDGKLDREQARALRTTAFQSAMGAGPTAPAMKPAVPPEGLADFLSSASDSPDATVVIQDGMGGSTSVSKGKASQPVAPVFRTAPAGFADGLLADNDPTNAIALGQATQGGESPKQQPGEGDEGGGGGAGASKDGTEEEPSNLGPGPYEDPYNGDYGPRFGIYGYEINKIREEPFVSDPEDENKRPDQLRPRFGQVVQILARRRTDDIDFPLWLKIRYDHPEGPQEGWAWSGAFALDDNPITRELIPWDSDVATLLASFGATRKAKRRFHEVHFTRPDPNLTMTFAHFAQGSLITFFEDLVQNLDAWDEFSQAVLDYLDDAPSKEWSEFEKDCGVSGIPKTHSAVKGAMKKLFFRKKGSQNRFVTLAPIEDRKLSESHWGWDYEKTVTEGVAAIDPQAKTAKNNDYFNESGKGWFRPAMLRALVGPQVVRQQLATFLRANLREAQSMAQELGLEHSPGAIAILSFADSTSKNSVKETRGAIRAHFENLADAEGKLGTKATKFTLELDTIQLKDQDGSDLTYPGGEIEFDAAAVPPGIARDLSTVEAIFHPSMQAADLRDWHAFLLWQEYRCYKVKGLRRNLKTNLLKAIDDKKTPEIESLKGQLGASKSEARDRLLVAWEKWYRPAWGDPPTTCFDPPNQHHTTESMPVDFDPFSF